VSATPTQAAARTVSTDVHRATLEPTEQTDPLATAATVLATHAGVEVGLWEAGPGTDADVEDDELFVVLSGEGEVAFDDGSTIALGPGVLVRLHAGDRTTWTITRRLRKLYLA